MCSCFRYRTIVRATPDEARKVWALKARIFWCFLAEVLRVFEATTMAFGPYYNRAPKTLCTLPYHTSKDKTTGPFGGHVLNSSRPKWNRNQIVPVLTVNRSTGGTHA